MPAASPNEPRLSSIPGSAPEPAGPAPAETIDYSHQPAAAEPGTQPSIPGYEILEVIGRGGMGVVYKARQKSLKRTVALKMILGGSHAGPGELARFRAEAEAVAQLQHPHIVQIHEIGQHQELPYFSLEFVGGGSLRAKLSATPQLPRTAAQMVEKLAQAVHAAHQRGIVHRDLKPANVLLAASDPVHGVALGGQHFVPKITDFGLAKRLDDDSGQTQTGQIVGTPSYMAPEQAAGKVRQIGPLADVYALGALLYEMLTGRCLRAGCSRGCRVIWRRFV